MRILLLSSLLSFTAFASSPCNTPKKETCVKVSFIGGVGPSDNIRRTQNQVELNLVPLFGIQYQRSFNTGLILGGQVLTNSTAAVLIGLEF